MTQAIAKQQRQDIRTLLQSDRVKEQISLVLPKHMTADRMARVAVTAVLKTPKLADCRPESLLQALMLCSQTGLEPDGRNAHLIPYGDQVQVIFDYKGLIALARRSGVQNIAADVVCEGDQFEWFRDAEGLHFRHLVDWKKKRGDVYAAYCIWKDGDQFDGEVMTRDEVDGIRKRSRAGNNGPWVTDWCEMAKKTVIRRASKKWPLDPETALAFNGDDDRLKDAPAATSRPVFNSAPAPQLFIGDPQAAGEEAQPEAPAEAPAQTEEAPQKNYLKAVRGLLKLAGKKDADLLNWMRREEKCDESLSSLEEVATVAPAALAYVYDNWAAVKEGL